MPVFHLKTHPNPVISVIIPSRDGDAHGNVQRLVRQLHVQERINEAEILLVVAERPNGHARNVGVDAAAGRWLVFMDDDAGLCGRRILVELLAPLEQGLEVGGAPVGMTGSATALPEDSGWFQHQVAAALPRALFPEVDRVTETDMAHHLCCALSREIYEHIGRESDTLETGTDVDLRQRLRAAGLRIAVVPHTVATHPQPDSLRELWRKHLWYGCGRVQLDRMHPPAGGNMIRGGRGAVIRYLGRALATAPLRCLRYDRSSPWRWNPLLAFTDLAQKVGYGRAYWRHLKGLGPRWEPLGSSRQLEQALRPALAGTPPQPPQRLRRLLVVLTAGMGDAITFLPVLRALRQAYPDCHLTVWTARAAATQVIRMQGTADHIEQRSLAGGSRRFRILRKLAALVWLRRCRFDLAVVNFINSNEESAVLLRLAGIPLRLGYVDDLSQPSLFNLPVLRPAPGTGAVAAERHLDLLPALGLERSQAHGPRWSISPAARQQAQQLAPAKKPARQRIGLHPGSGADMAWKRWPEERFALLADRLAAGGADVWLFGGPDERELVSRVAGMMKHPARDWTGTEHLDVTAALLEMCDLVVSNDSGLYNLALAVDVPVVALFGPTMPELSGPWTRSQDTAVVARPMHCRPCMNQLAPPRDLHCPINRACLDDIHVDQVEAQCRQILQPGLMMTAAVTEMTTPAQENLR